MTVITVNALETMLGGAAAAAKAYIRFEYRMAGEKAATTVDGADVTLARTIEVNIAAGVPEVPIDAPATIEDVTYAHVTVGSKMPGTPVVRMDVIIPESGTPVDIGALVVVDPASFEIVQPGSTVAQVLALKANADAVYSKTVADERFATAAQGGKADSAYQLPDGGVPASDLAEPVAESLGKADSAYQKPAKGVPASDLEEAVRTSLTKADEAVPNTVEGRTALAASPELGAAYGGIARTGFTYQDRTTPTLTRQGVVLQRGVATVNGPIGFPSILLAEGLIPSPDGRYAAFFSTDHAAYPLAGIYLSWFDVLGEAWSTPQLILQHGTQTETPDVIYDEPTGTLRLYVQEYSTDVVGAQAGQVTILYTTTPARFSADPTDWDYIGISHDLDNPNDGSVATASGGSHFGYQRICQLGGVYVSRGLYSGGGYGKKQTMYSLDGIRFYPDYRPDPGQPDIAPSDRRYLLDDFVLWGGEVFGVGRSRGVGGSGGADTVGDLIMGRVTSDLSRFAGVPDTVFTPAADGAGVTGDNGDVKGFDLYIENGEAHLFYASDANTISYAKVA